MTPEWLWSASIAIPALLLGWWVFWTVGWLWRRTVWLEVAGDLRALGGSVEPSAVWGGWRLVLGTTRITWRGGPFGMSTVIRSPGKTRRFSRLLGADDVREAT